MRITVLSFCIVVSLFSVSPVFAQENAPGYFNDRSYPNEVTKKQQENTSFIVQVCEWFGLFECEGVRSHKVTSPESLSVTDEEISSAQPVQGASTSEQEKALAQLDKDLNEATTSGQVLGILDLFNRIFGGNSEGTGYIDTYKPANTTICNSNDPNDCTTKLAIALRPASMQVAQTIPVDPTIPDSDSDGVPDSVDTDPTVPDAGTPPDTQPVLPPIGPQPPPTGTTAGYDLVAGIKTACRYNGTPGRIHETNVGCLNNVVPRLGFGVIPELRNSAVAYTNLQCVGFVRGMNLHFKGKALDGGGNANMFATNIPTGYRLVSRHSLVTSPKVGDLLLWNTGAFGHIAYIITVYDTNYVDVIEANWGVDGLVQVRRVNVRAGDILGWLTQ